MNCLLSLQYVVALKYEINVQIYTVCIPNYLYYITI